MMPAACRATSFLFLLIAPVIWAPIISYVMFAPERFTSNVALILPGAGVSTSINLSDIGQATTSANSPYSSSSISPTGGTYPKNGPFFNKNILVGHQVRAHAIENRYVLDHQPVRHFSSLNNVAIGSFFHGTADQKKDQR